MNAMRKKRLVTIHLPGEVTYDADGFPTGESKTDYNVYCSIEKVKPDELTTYNINKLTEVLRLRCPWGRVRNFDPQGVMLTIDGREYELFGPFVNVDMLNIEAEFEAKRVT